MGKFTPTHNLLFHPLYEVWRSMKRRCYETTAKSYHLYGGRGITVCQEWEENPTEPIKWAETNGWVKGLTIDRISNEGNYEPTNCRLSTMREQNNNRRNTLFYTIGENTKSLADWCRERNSNYGLTHYYLTRGFYIEEALSKTQNYA